MVKTRFNKKTVCVENESGEQKCHEEENPPPPILDKFRQERDLDMDWPEDLTGCNFNQTVRTPRTSIVCMPSACIQGLTVHAILQKTSARGYVASASLVWANVAVAAAAWFGVSPAYIAEHMAMPGCNSDSVYDAWGLSTHALVFTHAVVAGR